MLQVPELKRAMGFVSDTHRDLEFTLKQGCRRDRVRLLSNGVCPPVMCDVLRSLTVRENGMRKGA